MEKWDNRKLAEFSELVLIRLKCGSNGEKKQEIIEQKFAIKKDIQSQISELRRVKEYTLNFGIKTLAEWHKHRAVRLASAQFSHAWKNFDFKKFCLPRKDEQKRMMFIQYIKSQKPKTYCVLSNEA